MGADALSGLESNNTIEGGLDSDTALFGGRRSDYSIIKRAGGVLEVSDLRSGSPDGTDKLLSIENLKFSDAIYTLSQLRLPRPEPDGRQCGRRKSIGAGSAVSVCLPVR